MVAVAVRENPARDDDMLGVRRLALKRIHNTVSKGVNFHAAVVDEEGTVAQTEDKAGQPHARVSAEIGGVLAEFAADHRHLGLADRLPLHRLGDVAIAFGSTKMRTVRA